MAEPIDVSAHRLGDLTILTPRSLPARDYLQLHVATEGLDGIVSLLVANADELTSQMRTDGLRVADG